MELRRRQKQSVEEIAQEVGESLGRSPFIPSGPVTEDMLIPTGSTLLNLVCSGFSPHGGYVMGSVVHFIGDSKVGKTLLNLSMMAEVCGDSRFDGYDLFYEEPEARMLFPLEKMFGKKIHRVRFIPEDEERVNPRTVQDWHDHLVSISSRPFIQATDSFDALAEKGTLDEKSPEKGGWKTQKAVVASNTYPKIIGPMKANNSLLVVINQTRDNIGVTFGEKKTFSGGNAIKFYRCHEIWLAHAGKITKDVRGKKRDVGANVVVRVKKNSVTGRMRDVSFPVYNDYGVDDVTSMVDWMVAEGFWGKSKGGRIETEDPFVDGYVQKIVEHVEENNMESKLKEVVAECWRELEGEISIKRKPRY